MKMELLKPMISRALALILLNCTVGAVHAESPSSAASDARKNEQYVSDMGSRIKSQAAALKGKLPEWQSVDGAPSDFPLPLFKGNETQFLATRLELPPQINGDRNYYIVLRTKDSISDVSRWYKEKLPGKGLKLVSDNGPKAPGSEVVRAESETLSCAAVVNSPSGKTDYTAMVQVSGFVRGKR